MSRTAQLALPLVLPAQAQKHVTVNEALARLDAAAQLRVVSFAETTPPPSAVDGAGYARAGGGVRRLGGQGRPDRDLVQRRMDLPRAEGGMAGLGRGGGREPDLRRRRMGGERGRGLGGRRRLDLSGARVRSLDRSGEHQPDGWSAIPAMAQVVGVTGRVTAAIAGPALTGWRVGVPGSGDRYGTGLGTAANSYLLGLSGTPVTYYAADASAAVGGRRQLLAAASSALRSTWWSWCRRARCDGLGTSRLSP